MSLYHALCGKAYSDPTRKVCGVESARSELWRETNHMATDCIF